MTIWRKVLATNVLAIVLINAAHAVTPAAVSTACGSCHGLSVNGVTVTNGPGSQGFTSYVSGRDQNTWVNTINRMVGHGAVVNDVNGTAAYLAALGVVAGTPTPTPAVPFGTTGTPTFTPTPTTTPRNSVARGAIAYQAYCASCHEATSTSFVGETVYGSSLGSIREALGEVPQMQFLSALLTRGNTIDIARYLRASRRRGGGGRGEGGGGGGAGAGSRGEGGGGGD